MTKEPKVSELITMRQAARYCGRSHGRVKSYAQSGRLRAWKVGMQWLTTKKEVDHFFKTRNERWLNLFQRMVKFAKTRAEYRCEYCGRPEGSKVQCHGLTVYYYEEGRKSRNTRHPFRALRSPSCHSCFKRPSTIPTSSSANPLNR